MKKTPVVLDACCGGRMFWFDGHDDRAVFMDVREGEFAKDVGTPGTRGRKPVVVRPDILCDFTSIPFRDEAFYLVVFDPPHHTKLHFGQNSSIMQNCYGVLLPGWEEMLRKGFEECFRVLKPNGTLIFKWASREIPLERVLALTPQKPLFGHRSGKKAHTHWVAFIKS
jgi:SAM-dependent methyltransferase